MEKTYWIDKEAIFHQTFWTILKNFILLDSL